MIDLHECFTWDDGNGTSYLFPVGLIRAYIAKHHDAFEPDCIELSDSLKAFLVSDRVEIDPAYIDAMRPERRDVPALVAEIDGFHVLIDGNHRVRRRMQDGCDDFMAYRLPLVWLKSIGLVRETRT